MTDPTDFESSADALAQMDIEIAARNEAYRRDADERAEQAYADAQAEEGYERHITALDPIGDEDDAYDADTGYADAREES